MNGGTPPGVGYLDDGFLNLSELLLNGLNDSQVGLKGYEQTVAAEPDSRGPTSHFPKAEDFLPGPLSRPPGSGAREFNQFLSCSLVKVLSRGISFRER